jgi:translocation and assembly module TamA
MLPALVLLASASGCGPARSAAGALTPPAAEMNGGEAEAAVVFAGDIARPEIPAFLARAAAGEENRDRRRYAYAVDCASPEDPELAELFLKVSRLAVMSEGRAGRAVIEQRLKVSLGEGRDILDSRGYYEGRVEGRLEFPTDGTAKAVVRFSPGPRYRLGRSVVSAAGPLATAPDAPPPPASLQEVGLAPGAPALADDILEATARLETAFRNSGYPLAAVSGARYALDHEKKLLNASIVVTPGPFARMGDIDYEGPLAVGRAYLEALRPWTPGRPWRQDLADDYALALRQSGLFQEVSVQPAAGDALDGTRPVTLKLSAAPERTVGGLAAYDTDFGPGLTAYWEHRNLTGHGDRLRLDLPLWADLQEVAAAYRYPFFINPKQDFIAAAGLIHEEAEAYKMWSGQATAGLERRLARRWKAAAQVSAEGGALTEEGQARRGFMMLGLPLSIDYDNADSLLDPTRGERFKLLFAPYAGRYHDDFDLAKVRLEAQGFRPLTRDGGLTLALRLVWGALWGAASGDIPASARFYSGGGGSVRGYDYQSVGPRNAAGKPLGGSAQVEMNAEVRARLSEDIGLAAFIDGGMVYDHAGSDAYVFENLQWGAGLGGRYYTPIGPVRLDVAAPLNKRPGDSPVQLYLSIGQSF